MSIKTICLEMLVLAIILFALLALSQKGVDFLIKLKMPAMPVASSHYD
jgi:hypothetical protein